MSKFDSGKHSPNLKKRLDPQRPPKNLAARQADYEGFIGSVPSNLREGYHRPGSQQK